MERSVLITGAGSGIGLATALALARHGYHTVGGVRSAEKTRRLADAAASAGLAVETVALDVTDPQSCARAIEQVRPWALVNNAGFAAGGAIEDVDDAEARAALETMVVGPMRLARLALPHMRARGGGRIVNVSSVYGWNTTPLTGWYQAAKHALEGLSDALRVEVASSGVSVIVVQPGTVRTPMWRRPEADLVRWQGSRYEPAYRRFLAGVRMARPIMADARRVAAKVARAITARSPRARYLVGYDAWLLATVDHVPTAMRDRLFRHLLRL
jgi:NAD(P)-dependent dehydrogenase (short-subunit alcohol dehydrogenase family)